MGKSFQINSAKDIIKNKCEVDDCNETTNLHLHHIIPRTDPNTSNHPLNLAILCPNHHEKTHDGSLYIIGLFPSTKLPNKRTLVYKLNGKKNIDIDQSYIKFKAKTFKLNTESE